MTTNKYRPKNIEVEAYCLSTGTLGQIASKIQETSINQIGFETYFKDGTIYLKVAGVFNASAGTWFVFSNGYGTYSDKEFKAKFEAAPEMLVPKPSVARYEMGYYNA
jgi:hypothetical protein